MKFWKTTLAVVVGIFIASILSIVITLAICGSLGKPQPSIPKSGVLKIDLSTISLMEQATEANPFEMLGSGNFQAMEIVPVGLWDAVRAINTAAEDPAVKYIYLKAEGAIGYLASFSELRTALSNFRKSGKAVISYIESPTTLSYYMSTVADKVYMGAYPGSMINVNGISARMLFFKDLLDKFGVNMQLIRHGKYKSAGEMYIRNSPSAENMEQNRAMVDSIWETICAQIAEGRGLTPEAVNAAIDNLELCLPEDFVRLGFADELLTRTQLEDKLASLAQEEKYSKVHMIPFADYVAVCAVPSTVKQKIAVIYADGEIIDGSDFQEVAGDRFAATIEKVRADSTVKAVVLRVNSPGGSVVASDKIKVELDLLKEVKPLIASYGGYAASGGYWISNNADKIFTDALTLTGSIGVFGLVPDFSKTAKDVAHVGVVSVNSNKHSDMFGTMRPLDGAEQAYMQRSIEEIYERFTATVAQGRGMEQSAVDAIGQGRVWTGAAALGIGLVDEIGTLEDAIRYAAVCAGDSELANWNIKGYPKPLTLSEQLMMSLNGGEHDYSITLRKLCESRVVARMPYGITVE